MGAFAWCKRLSAVAAMVLMMVPIAGANAPAGRQNLVQLIASSQSIVAGTVRKVSDGVDANGMPYTEVTIAVGVSPKGGVGPGDYTFRQFGLIKPRTLPNGQRLLMVTPAEFPLWRENEYVVAFFYHPAAKTGLQTTSGLAQGKLTRVNDRLSNVYDNAGLFENITVSPNALSADEQALLQSHGPVGTAALLGLIGRIVKEQMIERGVIR